MREPMMGHLDPTLHELLLDLIEMLRAVYGVHDGIALPLQATGMSGSTVLADAPAPARVGDTG